MSDVNVETTPVAPADTGATPTPATSGVSATPVATPQVTPAPATSGAPEGYVPSYRLRETREAAIREAQTAYQQQYAALQAETERYKQQVQALVGVTPPANPETENIREQFFQLFPWAKKLEDRFGDIEQVIDRFGDVESQNEHYWQAYGRQTMDRLFDHAEKSLGGPLTEEGKRQLHSSFVGYIQSSPEATSRYTNDPTIVEDFWKQFTASFIDPVRRGVAANTATRAQGGPLPQDTPSGTPRAAGAPAPANLDERAALAWTQFQQLQTK